ncbi:MAG: DUF1840 family protein [Methylococcales bacterium]
MGALRLRARVTRRRALSFANRAWPLIELFTASAAVNCRVMWDKQRNAGCKPKGHRLRVYKAPVPDRGCSVL